MQLLKPKEVCERLGITINTLNRWVRERGFPYIALGPKRRLYDWPDCEEWLEKLKQRGYLKE